MNARVAVQYGTRRPWAPAVPTLRRWAAASLGRRHRAAELGIRVVGAAEGRRLNRDFRGKDKATNVIYFLQLTMFLTSFNYIHTVQGTVTLPTELTQVRLMPESGNFYSGSIEIDYLS